MQKRPSVSSHIATANPTTHCMEAPRLSAANNTSSQVHNLTSSVYERSSNVSSENILAIRPDNYIAYSIATLVPIAASHGSTNGRIAPMRLMNAKKTNVQDTSPPTSVKPSSDWSSAALAEKTQMAHDSVTCQQEMQQSGGIAHPEKTVTYRSINNFLRYSGRKYRIRPRAARLKTAHVARRRLFWDAHLTMVSTTGARGVHRLHPCRLPAQGQQAQ